MLVSIIIPCYNNSATIIEAVESARLQNHDKIEIIVVNDGSTDNSEEVITAYIQDKINISYHKKPNGGPSSTRNMGGNLANGEFLVFLDGDDRLHPDYVKKCLQVYHNQPNMNIVYSQAEYFGAKSGIWALNKFDINNFLIDNCIPIYAMIRTQTFKTLGGFDEHLKFVEDWELWLNIIKNYGANIHRIEESLYYYRKSETHKSLTDLNNDSNNDTSDISRLYIYNKHYDLFKEHNRSLTTLMVDLKYRKKYYNTWYRKFIYKYFKPKKYEEIYSSI